VTEVDDTAPAVVITDFHLEVDTRNGPWSPEQGGIEVPEDRELLPSRERLSPAR
jgi:hypothetical protein